MFLLSFIALIWILSVLARVLAASLVLVFGDGFRLRNAELVVANTAQEPGSLHSIDITREMVTLRRQHGCRRLELMPGLMRVAFRGDLRDTLVRCYANSDVERSRVQRSPMCFLDIHYTVNAPWRFWKRSQGPMYRCLYPIYSFSDYVYYPPRCPWAVPTTRSTTAITSAILTLRYTGEMTRQLSCNVTEQVRLLEGPLGDFHRESHAGYQLRKQILRVVLMPDIRELMDALDRDQPPPSSPDSVVDACGGGSSSNSLKSLNRSSRPPVSIRLQVKAHNNRTEVMNLESLALMG